MLVRPVRRIGSSEATPMRMGSGLLIEDIPLLPRPAGGIALWQMARRNRCSGRELGTIAAPGGTTSQFGKHDTLLLLIFALAIGIADFAGLISPEKQNLAQSLVGVNLGRQRRGIGNFQGHKAFPFRLEGSYVHNDSATRIGR